jgi:hypothetical protein
MQWFCCHRQHHGIYRFTGQLLLSCCAVGRCYWCDGGGPAWAVLTLLLYIYTAVVMLLAVLQDVATGVMEVDARCLLLCATSRLPIC